MRSNEHRLSQLMSTLANFIVRGVLVFILASSGVFLLLTGGIAQEGRGSVLVRALQAGGYVIYFRHAATDQTQVESNRVALEDCRTQRNLTEMGREQARTIGTAFSALHIKVSKLFSSPYCRAVDTAKLAFGDPIVLPDLAPSIVKNEIEAKRGAQVLAEILKTRPPEGTNVVVVSHLGNLKDAVGVWPDSEGAAHIFTPDGTGKTSYLARIGPEEWPALIQPRPPPYRL
jgi:phosphohistidine phosphatase SixA